jgi:glycine oxidase
LNVTEPRTSVSGFLNSSQLLTVAIAGAGLIGLSIAWRLALQKFRVTVFERKRVGSEASWAGAGMLSLGGEFDAPSSSTTFAIDSRQLYPAFVRELEAAAGTPIDYQECGALDLAYDAAEWVELRDRAERQKSLGIHSKPLSETQVRTFWPRVRSADLVGGIFYPGDAIVNPRELVVALVSACRQLGVEILEHSPVTRIAVEHDQVTVETDGDSRDFNAVVIAAGAWSSSIQVKNLPLPLSEPVKGHLIGFHQPEQTCNTIIRHGHSYLLQRANGLLIAGASVEHVGWDPRIEAGIIASLAEEASFLLPHLRETSPSETWIGFRPGSDTLHLGEWHSPRLYLAYGHYRNGILLAPATAQKIEREISANLRKR